LDVTVKYRAEYLKPNHQCHLDFEKDTGDLILQLQAQVFYSDEEEEEKETKREKES